MFKLTSVPIMPTFERAYTAVKEGSVSEEQFILTMKAAFNNFL